MWFISTTDRALCQSLQRLATLNLDTVENDFRETFGIEGSTPNQSSIDIRLTHELACIARFNTAAVLNTHLTGDFIPMKVAEHPTNKVVYS